MVNVALLVRLDAKPGKRAEIAEFLKGGLAIVEEESTTIAWFGIRPGLYPNSNVTKFWNQGSKSGNWRIRSKNRPPSA